MKNSAIKTLARISGAIICLACATTAFGQFNDWKGQKIEATLKRKRPPQVYLHGTGVKLDINSTIHRGRDYRAQIQSRLESGLFAQDSRLRPGAETIIVCNITRLDADDNEWQSRAATERRKVGEQQVYNQEKRKMETKDVYRDVEVTRRYKIVKGGISISYKALDAKSKAVLDAQNIQQSFSQDYSEGTGAPSEYEVCEQLINAAIDQIVMRLALTTEPVKIFLPRGKVEDVSKLGQAGLWEKMREGMKKMGELKNPKDEAYRQFGIGAASEGMAYLAEDLTTTQTLLEAAVVHYNQAIEMKSDEKYFLNPLKRIEESLAQYKKLSSQLALYAQSRTIQKPAGGEDGSRGTLTQPVPAPRATPAPASKQPAPSGAVTNQQVIEMVKAGLSEAIIITSLKRTPAVQFDLSPQGLIELGTNKVSEAIINAMQARQNQRQAPPRRKSSTIRKND